MANIYLDDGCKCEDFYERAWYCPERAPEQLGAPNRALQAQVIQ
jgi:hypothetical protein